MVGAAHLVPLADKVDRALELRTLEQRRPHRQLGQSRVVPHDAQRRGIVSDDATQTIDRCAHRSASQIDCGSGDRVQLKRLQKRYRPGGGDECLREREGEHARSKNQLERRNWKHGRDVRRAHSVRVSRCLLSDDARCDMCAHARMSIRECTCVVHHVKRLAPRVSKRPGFMCRRCERQFRRARQVAIDERAQSTRTRAKRREPDHVEVRQRMLLEHTRQRAPVGPKHERWQPAKQPYGRQRRHRIAGIFRFTQWRARRGDWRR